MDSRYTHLSACFQGLEPVTFVLLVLLPVEFLDTLQSALNERCFYYLWLWDWPEHLVFFCCCVCVRKLLSHSCDVLIPVGGTSHVFSLTHDEFIHLSVIRWRDEWPEGQTRLTSGQLTACILHFSVTLTFSSQCSFFCSCLAKDYLGLSSWFSQNLDFKHGFLKNTFPFGPIETMTSPHEPEVAFIFHILTLFWVKMNFKGGK